ncbi:siderophore ABC transporter substrate-binding protein [Basilea psittacipulmonis]|uniref:Enterochelin ABC transporter substrate-binding protein n=1 Tax=Basilea psittacipulmonis DSM 24701 TaxID=1072685 RepID=A0A077DBE6_9BURK|nr:siderophore ABC transporter substrate-binding protein [Basilea psittacipulmonis]AIL32175.1 enterochelin ABC transporter substrate-binding protein [Basilea psittacipulmonis DSM 24701]
MMKKRLFTLFATLFFGMASADTLTINTARGEVSLKTPIQTVAVFDLATADTLQALDVPIAGLPERTFTKYLAPLHAHAKSVGTVFEPNLEALAELNPDLIIVASRSSSKLSEVQKVSQSIDLTDKGADLLSDARNRIHTLGKIFQKEAQAQKLDDQLSQLIDETRAAVKDKGKTLMVMVNGNKLSTFGPKSRFGWIFNNLGITPADNDNVDATHGQPISNEYIQKVNPDWLIVLDRSAAIGEEGQAAAQTLNNPLVASTTAWKKGQVIYLDGASYVASGGYTQITQDLKNIKNAYSQAQ